MANRDVNIILRAKDAASGAFNTVRGNLAGLKQEVGKASGAVSLLNKGFVAIGAIGGVAAALKEVVSGTGDATERVLKGVQALPFGIGEAAKLGEQLYNWISGTADEAERFARAQKLGAAIDMEQNRGAEAAQRADERLKLLQTRNPFDRIRTDFSQRRAQVDREVDAREREIGGPVAGTAEERRARKALLDEEEKQAIAKERQDQLRDRRERMKAAQEATQGAIDDFFGGVTDFFKGARETAERLATTNPAFGGAFGRAATPAESPEIVARFTGRSLLSGNAPAFESRFLRGNLGVATDPSLQEQKKTTENTKKTVALLDTISKILPSLVPGTSNIS